MLPCYAEPPLESMLSAGLRAVRLMPGRRWEAQGLRVGAKPLSRQLLTVVSGPGDLGGWGAGARGLLSETGFNFRREDNGVPCA